MGSDLPLPATGKTGTKASNTTATTMATSAPTFTRAARTTSTSRANLARLPSLKQLTDRLQPREKEKERDNEKEKEKEKEQEEKKEKAKEKEKEKVEKAALNEITTITTNIPIAAPTPVVGSRLKLPASAVARANLSPDGSKEKKEGSATKSSSEKAGKAGIAKGSGGSSQAESKAVPSQSEPPTQPQSPEPTSNAPSPEPQTKETAAQLHSASEKDGKQDKPGSADQQGGVDRQLIPNALNADLYEVGKAKSDKQTKDNHGKSDVHRTVRALGMGRPGVPCTPPSHRDSVVPDIVVQSSTPDKGEVSATTEKRAAAALASGQHPLAHAWTLYYDSKTYKPEPSTKKANLLNAWEASLLHVGTFDTVEGFARHMNNIRLPSGLGKGANYHMFKDGIKPLWEDPANKSGGKWVMLVRGQQSLIDTIWSNLAMALVGQVLDPMDSVCGIVVSARPKMDRIQIWTRGRDDYPALNALANRIMSTMALEPREAEGISLEFNSNKPGEILSDSKLLRITPNTRSASVANLPTDSPRQRGARLPSTPVNGSPVMMSPPMPLPSPVPRGVSSSLPLRRTSSGPGSNPGSGNPFAGPLGMVRGRLGNAAS